MSVSSTGVFTVEPVLGDADILRWCTAGTATGDGTGGTVTIDCLVLPVTLDVFGGKWLWNLTYVMPTASTNPGTNNTWFSWWTGEPLRFWTDTANKIFRVQLSMVPQLNDQYMAQNYCYVLPRALMRPRMPSLFTVGTILHWDANVNGCSYYFAAGGFIIREQALKLSKVLIVG